MEKNTGKIREICLKKREPLIQKIDNIFYNFNATFNKIGLLFPILNSMPYAHTLVLILQMRKYMKQTGVK